MKAQMYNGGAAPRTLQNTVHLKIGTFSTPSHTCY